MLNVNNIAVNANMLATSVGNDLANVNAAIDRVEHPFKRTPASYSYGAVTAYEELSTAGAGLTNHINNPTGIHGKLPATLLTDINNLLNPVDSNYTGVAKIGL